MFSHLEKCDLLETYIVCQKNSERALERYRAVFPERNMPDRRYFLILYRKFRSNEKVFDKSIPKKIFIINEDTEINVLAYFEAFRENSTRDCVKDLGQCLGTIHNILKKYKYVPYKYRPTQTLLPGDQERRAEFCRWLINTANENPNILRLILWSDESNFSNRGMFNRKNRHYWSRENLMRYLPGNPQRRFSINVWCGLIGSKIVGPVFYEGTLTGERYLQLLRNTMENFLDTVNLAERQEIFFQQDGAPPHNTYVVGNLLTELFGQRWLATRGPILWPPRSPDITPLDFYFWGFLKNKIYNKKYNNVNELQESIINTINNIDGRTILKATRKVLKCARKCVEVEGGLFEHLM